LPVMIYSACFHIHYSTKIRKTNKNAVKAVNYAL
jgi:hypothetical protein